MEENKDNEDSIDNTVKIPKKISHIKTATIVNINAGHWPYSCGFFCVRTTNSDVIDPSKSSKKEDGKTVTLDTKNN